MPEPIVTPEVTPAAPVVVTPAAPVTPVEPSFTYKEDRSKWVDPTPLNTRLTAAERATNLASSRASQLEADLASERRRVQALAGLSPDDPAKEETDKVLAALYKMAPHLDPANQRRAVEGLPEIEEARRINRMQWDRHRDATFDQVKGQVAGALGLESLTPAAARKVIAAFKAQVPDQMNDAQGNPTNPEWFAWSQRYENKDPKLIEEFVNEFVSDFVEPAKRMGLVRPRMNVPSGGFSRPVATNQNKQPEYGKMKTVQEMLEAAEAQADAHYGT